MAQGFASAGLPALDAECADYTPTFSNFTLGDGVIDEARFVESRDNVVFVIVHVTLGSSSAVTGGIQVSLPATAVAFARNIFGAHLQEAGVDNFFGAVQLVSSTMMEFKGLDSSTNRLTFNGTSATEPFTWGDGDSFATAIWFQKA